MPLHLTLILLALSATVLAVAILQVRRPADPGNPRLLDWHYVMFPAILLTGLLLLHLIMVALGR